MRRLILRQALLIALLPLGPLAAVDTTAEAINARAQRHESSMAEAYKPVAPGLEGWFTQQRNDALQALHALLGASAGDDHQFIAYRILRLDPKDAEARAAFADFATAPLDERGAERALVLDHAADVALAEKVAALEYPPQEAVRAATLGTSPLVSAYWKAEADALPGLKQDLIALRGKSANDLAMQTLAYYWPDSKELKKWYATGGKHPPRDQWWIGPVDRFLVDHDLVVWDCLLVPSKGQTTPLRKTDAGSACGAAAWEFHVARDLRLEAVIACGKRDWPSFSFTDEHGRGVRVALTGARELTALALPLAREPLGKATLPFDATAGPFALELEVRGARLVARVAGMPVIVADLGKPTAFHRFASDGACTARVLRVRFIGSAAAAIVPPAWPAERRKDLDKTVTLAFSDTPVDEAVALLSKLCGVPIALDESGQLLKDLPVTLAAKDMRLETALQVLERLTDLHATPTADGITLSWKK